MKIKWALFILFVCFFLFRVKIIIDVKYHKSKKADKPSSKHPNYSHIIWKTIVPFAEIVAAIFTIIGVTVLDDMSNILKEQRVSKSIAISEWKESLACLKVEYSRDYIENQIGIPIISSEIFFENHIFNQCIYTNDIFTAICIYEINELIGFVIIGHNKNFDIENYRCNFSLFNYTINQAESYCEENGVYSILSIGSGGAGGRLDNSAYFYECKLQHSRGGGDMRLIGFGVCNIGFVEDRGNLMNDLLKVGEYNRYTSIASGNELSPLEYYNKSVDAAIREYPINTLFVFIYSEDILEFMERELFTYKMVISIDDYANMQENYQQIISDYGY